MTVLFGTVEYFEREFMDYLSKVYPIYGSKEDSLKVIYSRIENNLFEGFVCGEIIKKEYFKNLLSAYEKFKEVCCVWLLREVMRFVNKNLI